MYIYVYDGAQHKYAYANACLQLIALRVIWLMSYGDGVQLDPQRIGEMRIANTIKRLDSSGKIGTLHRIFNTAVMVC